MVGKRKNLNAFVEQSSYDKFDQGEDINFGDVNDDEKLIARKMLVTAFWCIQMKPTDCPSMNKVLEMLETNVELLKMPPKPFQLPFETSTENHSCETPVDPPTTSL
ncbi:hypothetical protein CRYUN_Cryun38cG0028400 [Craigia yunnanensis]